MSTIGAVKVGEYGQRCGLKSSLVCLKEVPPEIDLDAPGLIMHGSEADPYMILKFGLAPQQTQKNRLEGEWQICLGLSAKDKRLKLKNDLARKNSAVKYAGLLGAKGTLYVIGQEVKRLRTYREYWDAGGDGRGYAWLTEPIKTHLIQAIITGNLPLAAAAVASTDPERRIYKPDGTCFVVLPIE